MLGYVHSTDSFGTVDGPGIRFVVFMQGCQLRCKYCHNPDTWKQNSGKQMSVDEIIKKYESCKVFLKNGGLTVTGGEPLLQIDFVTELFKECKKRGIHTCLDTSGDTFDKNNTAKFDELMRYTDLVMLDIKHIDDSEHKKLTGKHNTHILDFADYLYSINKTLWVRHVVVPTITLDEKWLEQLGYFLGHLKNMKAVDVLPYHSMGNVKYENLGMKAPLKHLEDVSNVEAAKAREVIFRGIKRRLKDEIEIEKSNDKK